MIEQTHNTSDHELMTDVPLGRLLVARGLLSEEDLDRALTWQSDHECYTCHWPYVPKHASFDRAVGPLFAVQTCCYFYDAHECFCV